MDTQPDFQDPKVFFREFMDRIEPSCAAMRELTEMPDAPLRDVALAAIRVVAPMMRVERLVEPPMPDLPFPNPIVESLHEAMLRNGPTEIYDAESYALLSSVAAVLGESWRQADPWSYWAPGGAIPRDADYGQPSIRSRRHRGRITVFLIADVLIYKVRHDPHSVALEDVWERNFVSHRYHDPRPVRLV